MEKHAFEDLSGERLSSLIKRLEREYGSEERLVLNRSEASSLPEVMDFRDEYQAVVERAKDLAFQVEMAVLADVWSRSPGKAESSVKVNAVCYQHKIPEVVATASLPPNKSVEGHQFRHSDLTTSYHQEDIRNGKIYCHSHPRVPASLVVTGTSMRLFPLPHMKPNDVVKSIVSELAGKHGPNSGASSRGRKGNARDIETALNIIFQVGDYGGLFESLYEGLQQIRHRAVTSQFIAANAPLQELPQWMKKLLDYDQIGKISSEEAARVLRKNPFFVDLENITAREIPSPYVVMEMRVKGIESLTEKLVVARHWKEIVEGYHTGRLQAHFNVLGLEAPSRPKDTSPPHLDDYVTLEILLHDNTLTYDLFDLRNGFTLSPDERSRLAAQMAQTFKDISEVPEFGYKKKKGRGRWVPDEQQPKFAKEPIHVTKRGFVFWLQPEDQRFDDYALWPKKSGYSAIQFIIGSNIDGLDGAVVECQIKPNVIKNAERFSPREQHTRYKIERAGQLHFLRANGYVTPFEWEATKTAFTPPEKEYRETNLALTRLS